MPIGDVLTENKELKESVTSAVEDLFPIEGNEHKLELKDIELKEEMKPWGYKEQLQTKDNDQTYSNKAYGKFQLKDKNSGEIKDENKLKLFDLPQITGRGTYIVNGSEYSVPNLLKLKPGVFHQKKSSNRLNAQFNTKRGTGPNFNLQYRPDKQQFKMKAGGRVMDAYPMMKILGVNDEQMEEKWGKDMLKKNQEKADYNETIKKFYEAMQGNKPGSLGEAEKFAREKLLNAELDPQVTKSTLGEEQRNVNPESLLAASDNLIQMAKGEREEDDRDSLAYKGVHTIKDTLPDRLKHWQTSSKVNRKVKRNLDSQENVSDIWRSDILGNPTEKFFTTSQLAEIPEQTNPIEFIKSGDKVTALGEGALQSVQNVPEEVHDLNPSQLGFTDPIITPESAKTGIVEHTAHNTRIEDNEFRTEVVDPNTGETKTITPQEAYESTISFYDQYEDMTDVDFSKEAQKSDGLNPKKNKIKAMDKGDIKQIDSNEVDYVLPDQKSVFSPVSLTVPFLPTDQGNRTQMATKMMSQALPIENREAPLVQNKLDNERTVEERIGESMALKSPIDGTVKEIDDEKQQIRIEDEDGEVHKANYYKNFPLNRESFIDTDMKVEEGDEVSEGEVVYDNNFTKDGELAIGTNLKSVTEDTKVLIQKDGKIQHVKFGEIKPDSPIKVDTINRNDPTKQRRDEIDKFIAHPVDEGVKLIKTKSGREIKPTESHSMLEFNDGSLKETKPDDLVEGESWLPRTRYRKNITVQKEIEIESKLKEDITVPLTENFGYLLGLYLAEGCVIQDKKVNLAASHEYVREFLQTIIDDIEEIGDYSVREDAIDLFDSRLAQHLKRCAGRIAPEKKMPDYVFGGPTNFQKAVLGGYWAGDGTVCPQSNNKNKMSARASSCSQELRDDLALLCSMLNIDSTIGDYATGTNENGEEYKRSNIIRIVGSDIKDMPWIPYPKKERRIREAETDYNCAPNDPIPVWESVKDDIREAVLEITDSSSKLYKHWNYVCGKANFASRERIKELIKKIDKTTEDLTKLKQLAETDELAWDRVKSIEDYAYEGMVYDFEVNPENTFTLSNGISLHNTAYVPYRGHNYEDAIVVSDSGAEKLSTQRMRTFEVPKGDEVKLDKNEFVTNFPDELDSDKADKLNEQGLVEEGQTIEKGEPVAAYMEERTVSPEEAALGQFHKVLMEPWRQSIEEWDEDHEGKVEDVVEKPDRYEIRVKTKEKAKPGSKLANRHGNKGVISKVIRDSEMPKDENDEPLEMLLNPHGVVSRMNLGQLYENAAGKIAKDPNTDQDKYVVDNFDMDGSYKDIVEQDLKDAGISDKEKVKDPKYGELDEKVNVGQQYTMVLDHRPKDKFSARSYEDPLTVNLTPKSGKEIGGQNLGPLALNSMLSQGARKNLHEMSTYKASYNPEFWRAVETGDALPSPEPAFPWKKFEKKMNAAGVNLKKTGDKIKLMPFTEDQVEKQTRGEIENAKVITAKDKRPEKGGLFDPDVTGGLKGDRWGHVEFSEDMPYPIFEKPIKELTGLTKNEEQYFDKIMKGGATVDEDGNIYERGETEKQAAPEKDYSMDDSVVFDKVEKTERPEEKGEAGGEGLKNLLGQIDIDSKMDSLKEQAKTQTGSDLNKSHRKLRYLNGLQTMEEDFDSYFTKKLPVIPPKFRPIYPTQEGHLIQSDVNKGYRDVILSKDELDEANEIGMPEKQKGEMRKQTYESMKNLAGLSDQSRLMGREYRGVLDEIAGDSPKEGFFQDKVISQRQEQSGRAVALPGPDLSPDEVRIPEKMGWKIFRPKIVKKLHDSGYTPLEARKEVDEETDRAKQALKDVTHENPIYLNRAPSLHKFAIQSFNPKLKEEGTTIDVPPFVHAGYNLDHDGDTMAVHTPVTQDAIEEAKDHMPSQNLYNPANNELITEITHEALTGDSLITAEDDS